MIAIQDTTRSFEFNFPIPQSLLEPDEFFILIQKLVVAILIGVLIGMEREHSRPKSQKTFAGIRTYPLIAMLGFTAALVTSVTDIWMYAVFFLGYAALITTSYVTSAKEGRLGGTSEVASLLVFTLGSLVYWDMILVAATIAVFMMLFLSLKLQLHSFVGKISGEDIFAFLQLAIITVIILPLLPDKNIDPFDIINPRLIWLMVIFVSSISFIGYLLVKYIGKDKGIPLTGFLGGLVSSTAVTFSMAKRSKENEVLSPSYAVGVLLASSVMYLRVFIIIALLNSNLALNILLPLIILGLFGLAISYYYSKRLLGHQREEFKLKNPIELRYAVLFGLIFAAVLFASKLAQQYIGTEGIYAVSSLAGLTSVDAIVISATKLIPHSISINIAIVTIIIAMTSNTIVKMLIALYWGSKDFKKYVSAGLGIIVVVSLVLFWIYF